MQISAKVDYAVRALLGLASLGPSPITGPVLAESQGLPPKFMGALLADLRRSGLVASSRGSASGYRLGRSASAITIADVIRAVDGPLAEVRGERPEHTSYEGAAKSLQEVWIAVRASLREVLEATTIDDIATGQLPPQVRRLSADPDAWRPHSP